MEKEKKERRENVFEEWKVSPQFKAFQDRLKVISESLQEHMEAIQKGLEPIQLSQEALQKSFEPIQRAMATFKEAIPHLIRIFSDAEIGHKEAADFYRDWMEKAPIPQKEFLDWFFEVKHRGKTLSEMSERKIEVTVEDIEVAGNWLVSKIKEKQAQQLPKGQKSASLALPNNESEPKPSPQAFGPELLEVVKCALKKKKLLTLPSREYPNGQYIGKKIQTKALYNLLSQKGYILGIIRPGEQFAIWFKENLAGDISDRALRNPPSRGQKDEETDFRALIPAKK